MNLFKKTELSFDKFDQTIKRYLAKTFNNLGLEYTHTQIFGIIYDGIKGVMENIMFYIEDALTEQNIYKATRKESVYSLAKISGFEAYYGAAACGTIICQVLLNNGLSSKSSKIYLQDKTTLVNRNTGISYTLILPTNYYLIDLSKPLMSHEFKIVQGKFVRSTYVAKGYNLETIHVSCFSLFDRSYFEVKVNGEIWNEVGNLYDMGENTHDYIISLGYDNTIDIIFGNDVYGKTLNEGDTVTIDYLIHDGKFGNILSSDGYDFSFNEYGMDSLNNPVNLNEFTSISLMNCISGGNNSDSIQFIRDMIGTNSRSLVLVSEDNFKLFFKRFSFIGYVACWSEPNTMLINVTCLTNIKDNIKSIDDYYSMNTADMLLSSSQKEMIENTLENSKKTFAGITVKFQDPVIRKYAFICYVKIDNVYNKDITVQSIRDELGNYFLSIENDTLFIAKSDLISLLTNNISTIKAIDLDIISDYGEQAFYNKFYIKYELLNKNNKYTYLENRYIYEKNIYPGLDEYGNISLNSKLEIPIIHGGFNYYPNKESNGNDRYDSYKIPDIQVFFI